MMHPDYLLITQEIIDVLAREAEENTETTRKKMTLSASFFFSYRYRLHSALDYVSPNENQRQFNGMKKVA